MALITGIKVKQLLRFKWQILGIKKKPTLFLRRYDKKEYHS